MLGLEYMVTFTMIMVREVLHRVNSGDRDSVVYSVHYRPDLGEPYPQVDVVSVFPGDLGKHVSQIRDLSGLSREGRALTTL